MPGELLEVSLESRLMSLAQSRMPQKPIPVTTTPPPTNGFRHPTLLLKGGADADCHGIIILMHGTGLRESSVNTNGR